MSLHEKIPGFIILFVAVQNEICELLFVANATKRRAFLTAETDTRMTTWKFLLAGLIARGTVTALPAFTSTPEMFTTPTTRFLNGQIG